MVEDVTETSMVYMTHDGIDGAHDFADDPSVIEHFEARGWKVTKRPEPKPFVPDGTPIPETVAFVTMYHPGTKATHEFPANPDAIQGAQESGWRLMKDSLPEPESPPAGEDKAPDKKATKPAKPTVKDGTDNG
jgi:hypothetical protein